MNPLDAIMMSVWFWTLVFIFGIMLVTIRMWPSNFATQWVYRYRKDLSKVLVFIGAFGVGYSTQAGLTSYILDMIMNVNPIFALPYLIIWLLLAIWVKSAFKINQNNMYNTLQLTLSAFMFGIMLSAIITVMENLS